MRRSCAACKNADATGSRFIFGRSRLMMSAALILRSFSGLSAM